MQLIFIFPDMGKAKRLDEVEKGQIRVLAESGQSNRQIARKINRSEKVVRNYLKNPKKYGFKVRTRGNSKLTARQKGQIRDEATKSHLSCRQIITKLDLPVHKSTVSRVLNASSHIKWTKPKPKPKLTSQHKINRLKFAQNHMHWTTEWHHVIFSDEKKFNLDGPDCYSHYWHDLRDKEAVRSKRNFGGQTQMVWGGFSYDSKLPICWISTKMNSTNYCDLLEDVLIPHLEEYQDDSAVFQQDNASIHVSRQSKAWFEAKEITVLEWPACSPDLNPIENLWGILASKVYANGRQFNNVKDLKACIRECWEQIDAQTIQNLVTSMPKRIFEVIKNKGGPTKY